MALLYLGFPVNHDSVRVSQHAQYLKLEQQSVQIYLIFFFFSCCDMSKAKSKGKH